MTTIRYFIPEDGDIEAYPNVFLAPKPRQQGIPPTLGQIKDAFPLPGRYHFRFKSPLVPGGDREKDALAVWMDSVQDNMPVPTWRSSVIAKVTRVSMDDDDDEDDDDEDGDFHRHHHPRSSAPTAHHHHQQHHSNTTAPPPQQQQQQNTAPPAVPPPAATGPVFDVFDGPAPATPNLFDAPPPSHHPHPPAPTSGGSLLDMDTPYHNTQSRSTSSNGSNDFFGMPHPAAHTPSPPSGGFPGMTPQTYSQQQQPPPTQQQQARGFDGFSNTSQGPFGGLGTPWK